MKIIVRPDGTGVLIVDKEKDDERTDIQTEKARI